ISQKLVFLSLIKLTIIRKAHILKQIARRKKSPRRQRDQGATMNLVEIARAAAREARAGRSKLPADFSTEEALSGVKGRALLNNLCGHPGIRLLEIGAYAGSTLASALCGNEIDAVAVDTWYEFIMPSERASPL